MICEVCEAIPFDQLPYEEGLALPHHASIAALQRSARTCELCNLFNSCLQEPTNAVVGAEGREGLLFGRRTKRLEALSGLKSVDKSALKPESSLVGNSDDVRNIEGEERGSVENLGFRANYKSLDHSKWRPWIYGNWWDLDLEIPGTPNQLVGVGVRLSERPEFKTADGLPQPEIQLFGTDLRVLVNSGHKLNRYVPGSLPSSGSAWDKRGIWKTWVHVCDEHHKCASAESRLPTRILDLGPPSSETLPSTIKLISGRSMVSKYVALSHCWGDSVRVQTTSRNVESHMFAIKVSELPATFYDAMCLTLLLGIRYLWIDTLCIIQDDREDWGREASKMMNVYKRAYLTMCASASPDDSVGCFENHQRARVEPSEKELGENLPGESWKEFTWTSIPTRSFSGERSVLTFRKGWLPSSRKNKPRIYRHLESVYMKGGDPLAGEPLSTRGWCVQEAWLSPRKLHFGTNQVYFQCLVNFLAEDGSRYDALSLSNLDVLVQREKQPSSDDGIPPESGYSTVEGFFPFFRETGRRHGGWLDLVQDYSRRKLTYETDKLPALAGLAKYLGGKGTGYLAGLWRKHFLEDLFWRVYLQEEGTYMSGTGGKPGHPEIYGKQLSGLHVPAQWRAPSWSWASIDASVLFLHISSQQTVATLIDAETVPDTSNPFSSLKSGWAKLKAPLFPIIYPSARPKALPYGEAAELEIYDDISSGIIFFDLPTYVSKPPGPLLALFLDKMNALVIVQMDQDDESSGYRRIGVAKFLRTEKQKKEEGNLIVYWNGTWGPLRIDYQVVEVMLY